MSSQVTKHAALNPKTTHFEFFGPPGALAVTLGVPFLSYALNLGCSERLAACPPPLKFIPGFLLATVEDSNWWSSLWDTKVVLVYAGWYAFCVAAWAVLPGDYVEGLPLRTGGTKKYKINGSSRFFHLYGEERVLTHHISPQHSPPSSWLWVSSLAGLFALDQNPSPTSTKSSPSSSPLRSSTRSSKLLSSTPSHSTMASFSHSEATAGTSSMMSVPSLYPSQRSTTLTRLFCS